VHWTPWEREVQAVAGWFSRRILPYRTHDRRVDGVVIVCGDVTRLKRAALQQERLLATVLMDASDAVLVHDFAGRISVWNRGAERLYGYSAEEAVGMSIEKLLPPVMGRLPAPSLRAELFVDDVYSWEGQRIDKQRRALDVSSIATILRDHEGRSVGVSLTERNVSDRKLVERAVVDALSQEQRRIGQDLHDGLGQELTGLGLLAEDLAESLARRRIPDARQAQNLARSLKRLLSEVRLLSQSLVPLELQSQGLKQALARLVRTMGEQSSVKCTFECDYDDIDESTVANHVFRIAQEGIANALKHGKPTQVNVRLHAEGSRRELQIVDDGIGIKAADLQRGGLGLNGIRYRAGLISADMNLERASPHGTALSISWNTSS
jgi:PAS domain S-box-containing protein